MNIHFYTYDCRTFRSFANAKHTTHDFCKKYGDAESRGRSNKSDKYICSRIYIYKLLYNNIKEQYTYSIDDFLVDLFSYHESLRVWLRPPFEILAFLFTTLTTLSTILNLSVLCI